MRTNRPVFLDLWRIKLPVTGVVSILHRVSGVLLVLSIPYAVYLFDLSLTGPEGFAAASVALSTGFARLVLLVLAWSLVHHLFAGIRFLLLDLGVGLDRPVARKSALTAISAAVAVVLIGGGMLL
ncbi:MAG: succinate dehydrogenase, cytochrome b556 subunit [Pseudomonadota bacterium]|nr:succinate dehydrogenase, cytochrome b556 subunit [Pseudomonadota bacterium]